MPISWDPDRDAAVARAHEQFRWFGGGWKVNAELPGPAGFAGATQFVRPEDVAEAFTRARVAQEPWAATPVKARAAVLLRFHDLVLALAGAAGVLVIITGAEVFGADGDKVGTVAAVYPGYIVVEKGFFFPTDYYIPMSAVASARPECPMGPISAIRVDVVGDSGSNPF